jgi:hypothetical protein
MSAMTAIVPSEKSVPRRRRPAAASSGPSITPHMTGGQRFSRGRSCGKRSTSLTSPFVS